MLTGQTALVEDLKLGVRSPHIESRIDGAVRRSEVHANRTLEIYPRKQAHAGDLKAHLLFALRYEPTDLGVLTAAFKQLGPEFVRNWVLSEPTGSYARKAWFLYEFLVGKQLDLPNARTGKYVDVLDPKRHIVGARRTSTRHRVWDNLLGVPGYCPTVRRTLRLTRRMEEALGTHIAAMTSAVDPDVLRRAVSYLYAKETRSSFEIEGEKPSPQREERYVSALADAAKFDLDKAQLIALQNKIVDSRYAAGDWRDFQNYVGETSSDYREIVHFICPKPEAVAPLMRGLMSLSERVLADKVDAVIAAALVSFGFVFIHPFEDGNGRIHRFLIHNVLAKTGFSPEGVIFPISVAIVRNRAAYDAALEVFSRPLLTLTKWRLTPDEQTLVVEGDTGDLYRYFDCTTQAEYLYDQVAETAHKDLPAELDFLGAYDRAYEAVRGIVDMPNKKISLFVRFCMQNSGHLPKARRKMFSEITDDEVALMEAAVRSTQQQPPS